MAQVKFYNVSADTYAGYGEQGGEGYDSGAIYFIKDNGEIRKGDKHITGTRVYTAVDSTNGATPIGNLTILLNGSTPGANDAPKKGDILVVDQTLKAAQGTEGQEGYVPAIYAKAAYAHNGTDWEACDGNVDASKVILTQDYTLAGSYSNVGNLNKGTNYNASGKSVAKVLEEIFTQEMDDSSVIDPSFSLSGSNVNREVGSTYDSPELTATWSDGSYGYKAYWGDNDLRTETGAAVGTWTISAYNGQTTSDATISGNTAKINPASFTVTAPGSTTLASFNVTNDLTNIKKAATNLGNEGTKVISKTTNSAQIRTITGYQQIFTGSRTGASHLGGVDDGYYTANTDGTPTSTSNWNVRSSTKARSDSSTSAKPTQIVTQENTIQVMIAIPSTGTLTSVKDVKASEAEIIGNFTCTTMKIGGADSTSSSVGSNLKDYKVYVWTPSAKLGANTYKLTFTGL